MKIQVTIEETNLPQIPGGSTNLVSPDALKNVGGSTTRFSIQPNTTYFFPDTLEEVLVKEYRTPALQVPLYFIAVMKQAKGETTPQASYLSLSSLVKRDYQMKRFCETADHIGDWAQSDILNYLLGKKVVTTDFKKSRVYVWKDGVRTEETKESLFPVFSIEVND